MAPRLPKSLPPLVDGDVYGRLKVTVDEIIWCSKHSDEVNVLMQWWGDNETVVLRPVDVTKFPEAADEDGSVVLYDIQTDLETFEAYLKQCNKLNLLVVKRTSKGVVGHVEINDLLNHITGIQYQEYFPITTSSGSRLGELRVNFNFSMNSIPEESLSKKKKRSRKKNKPQNMLQLVEEDQKSKQIKKGCLTCSEHKKSSKPLATDNSLTLNLPKPPANSPANLNTERSDVSDCVLLEMLEKGKKLRDAMMLSVLEDIDTVMDKDLDFKLDQPEKTSSGYKSLKKTKNGEIVSPHEEKLINDYLEGKNMKEEEEILVLNTLHAAEKQCALQDTQNQNLGSCCLTSKIGCPHSQTTTADNTSTLTVQSSSVVGSDVNHWMNKVNCFRLTIDNLSLTKAGWKKIDQAADNKSKSGEVIPPPRATYFVECHFVEESPRSQVQQSKSASLRFCSRRQIENVIYFCQSSAHSLRQAGCVGDELAAMTCLVCWRHLNQRVPALLGHFSLAGLVSSLSPDTTATVPVTADNGATTAHLRLRLELGKDKLHFGRMLEDNASAPLERKKVAKEGVVKFKEVPLEFEDLTDKVNLCRSDYSEDFVNEEINTVPPNYDNIPVCSNCNHNMVLTNMSSSNESVLCISCAKLLGSRQATLRDPNFKISIPKNFSSQEHRIHEFMLNIDTVVGMPLFAGINDELSCYVDYKFPEITSNLKAEMGRSETTSRVVDCQIQPAFSSVQKHKLALPVVLPLSPLLAGCSPGVTLRLWLRYYKPTPRDHMVAMALLPMDELCLMELEFDKNPSKTAVTKVLELPLALVPSSVTAPYQQHRNVGVLRLSVTYSNIISTPHESSADNVKPVDKHLQKTYMYDLNDCSVKTVNRKELNSEYNPHPNGAVCRDSIIKGSEDIGFCKYQKMINETTSTTKGSESKNPFQINKLKNANVALENHEKSTYVCASEPVLKEEFEILAENLEKRFNQLQSDLLKERQKSLVEVDNIVTDSRKAHSLSNNSDEDFMAYNSITSSSESALILGPPSYFRDLQNTVVFTNTKKVFSDTQSERSTSNTISGFLAEEKEELNLNSNESLEKKENKKESPKPKTFKVSIKIDRAVNLKAVKGPTNGKKCKVPPSTWVSFGSGLCCEQSCGESSDLVCTGQKFSTPVIRRSYNPIWNLTWQVDLPLEYLQQVDKRLVFRVFEENLDVAFGFASANLSILTTGLPSLSSWLSINDLSGACKGQIKIVVTPMEDLSKYQECPVYDPEEEEFEEMKNNIPDLLPSNTKMAETTAFVASQTEVFVCETETLETLVKEDDLPKNSDVDEDVEREEPVLADDIISDYKNTLENNFRNEMAGLENLIKFLRVGSMNNEMSFLRSNENKENSNPTFVPTNLDSRTSSTQDLSGKISGRCSSSGNQSVNPNGLKERILIDASTETMNREPMPSSSGLSSSEDILSKLLQQISMFQLPTVKIADNTSQTLRPETRETYTETVVENQSKPVQTKTVHLKDAFTETDDLSNNPPSQAQAASEGAHMCPELGSVLQHFLTCRPAPIKTCDNSCQTTALDTFSSTNSSGLLARSLPSGMSSEVQEDNRAINVKPSHSRTDWISSEEAQSNCERLIAIDNNIKDLEKFLKENLMLADKSSIPSLDLKDESLCGSTNGLLSLHEAKADNENSSSDIESLENFSEGANILRETPDGGDIVSDTQDLTLNSDTDTNTATTMRRRGTFVIDKTKASSTNKE